ncbi:MAG: hypothetical protein CVU48_03870 [Candidatus Cloacimonetes bacterium HGW-Cloacimonetes-1]|jgi:hypothetical protein|nr:MAG: hypothetical protein CVU48_03870 [Candidatus Cloacimonetes bacterium HGW-Cloacimonetes-1]
MFRSFISKSVVLILLIALSVFALSAVDRTVNIGTQNQVLLRNNSDFGFDIQYKVGNFTLTEVNTKAGTFDKIDIEGYTHTNRIGDPQLPMVRKIIAVPIGAEVQYNFTSQQARELTAVQAQLRHRIMPAQESVSKSADPAQLPFILNEKSYMQNRYSGNDILTVTELGMMRGVRLVAIDFCPIQYNPMSNQIQVLHDAQLRINFAHPDLAATADLMARTASVDYDNLYAQTIFNWRSDERVSMVRYPTKMVILTPANYVTTLQPFVDWKRQQGFTVIVTTVGSGATVANSTTAIKTYLQGLWNAATAQNPAPTYLLIVGDHSTSGDNITSNTGTSGTHVTDLSYVRLNGTDIVPDMYYGRFSVSSSTELTNIINKTLMFEKTTMPDLSYLGKVVMIAGQDPTFGPTHGDGQINYGTANYFNAAHGITSNTYLYAVSGTSDAAIIANASEGRGYINYTAHGSETSWADPTFTVNDANNLTNTNKPFVAVGNCCVTNKFDYTGGPCFGEALIRASNRAAAAYIGATNNSYWDEDYWWGVGAKGTANGTAPAYNASTLGVYDGMFHTHSEAVTDWVQTVGDANYMGNLAVTQGASTRINYYWEIYSIMGDPSLMPYFGVPTVNTATYPNQILIGATSINVSADAQSRVALSMNGTLYGTAVVGTSGSLTLPITAFSTVGTAQLVFTRQNRITKIVDVQIIPNAGAYIGVTATTYSDTNNNVAEYNETGRFSVTFNNVGAVAASNVIATLTCATSGITFTDNTESITSLAAGASVTKSNAYTFNIANNVANGTIAAFTLTMVSGTDTWTHNFTQVINAPALSFGSMTILDPTGNNNGRIDPGESFTAQIQLSNAGAAAALAGSASLTSPTTGITITDGAETFTAIAASGSATISFTATAAASMTIGTAASFVFGATSGAYSAAKTEISAVGLILEDFETGNFNAYPWTLAGNQNWTVVNSGAYAGTYAAKSGAITHSQSTSMTTTRILTTAGNVSFWYKVSSEGNYDYLKFYIDNVLQGTGWSGEVAWTQATYPLSAGTRILKWEYMKDGSVDSGSNCAWIDNIIFPASTSSVTYNPPQNLTATAGNGSVVLSWQAPSSGTPTGYKIYKNSTLLTTVTALTYTDSAVTNGTLYSYYLIAAYTGGSSAATAVVSATPLAPIPQNLTATPSNMIVALAWQAPTTGTPSAYKIYRNSSLLTTVTALTYSDTAVTNGTSYSYYVTATYTSPVSESAASNTASATPSAPAPQTLVGIAGNGNVSLSWSAPAARGYETKDTMDRAFSGYKVYRNGSSLTPTAITALTYLDNTVINETSYSYYVTAIYASPAGESIASNTVSVTPTAAVPTSVTIGTSATTNQHLPLEPYYGYTYSQSIYMQNELNMPDKRIYKLAWQYNGNSAWTDAIKIYMGHTSTSSYASNSAWLPVSGLTQVYDGTMSVTTTAGWVEVTLNIPFIYNNTNNLVIAVDENTSGYHSSSDEFMCSAVTGNRSLYFYSDSINPDPVTPPTTGTYLAVSAYIPNVKLFFEDLPTAAMINVPTTTLDLGSVAVGTTGTSQFTIQNTGSQALTGSITTPVAYTVSLASTRSERNSLSINVPAGQTATYTVSFSPTAAQTYSGNIVINTNATNSSTVNVNVSGSGFIPPTAVLNVNTINASLAGGTEETRYFTISNTGSQPLNYTIGMEEFTARGAIGIPAINPNNGSYRSIIGSTLTLDTAEYTPGMTTDWTFTVTNASTDTEWLKDIYITFPTGVTVNSSTSFVGGTGGDMTSDNATGNGVQVHWNGVSGSWGVIHGAESATTTVNVSIAPGYATDMILAYQLDGDVYGAEPHTLSDAIVLTCSAPPVEWMSCTPMAGTIAPGANAQIAVDLSAFNMDAGAYLAVITVNSNDPVSPQKTVDVSMEVGISNHAPTIDLPTGFSFGKNSTLIQSFGSYINDSDGDPITLTVSGNTNITVNIVGSTVTLGAIQNWIGSETLSFTVSDGSLSNSDNVTVTVLPVNTPVWAPVLYPNNPATIYGLVTLDGIPAQANDMVAAFVGNECRGTTSVVIQRIGAYSTLLVQMNNPNEIVTLKVYAYATDEIYDVEGSMTVTYGEVIGSVDPMPITINTSAIATPITSIQSTPTGIRIHWNSITNVTHYNIYACDTPDGVFNLIDTVTDPEFVVNNPSRTMFYRIKAERTIVTK